MERSISIERTINVNYDAAAMALREDAAELVCDDPVERTLTVHADLAGFDVARVVLVTLGKHRQLDAHAVVVPLAWEAAEHPRRFPTVDGMLELSALSNRPAQTQLAFVGHVTPPLGALGTIGEAVGGRSIADAVLERVVERVANRLTIAVARRAAAQAAAVPATKSSQPRVILP